MTRRASPGICYNQSCNDDAYQSRHGRLLCPRCYSHEYRYGTLPEVVLCEGCDVRLPYGRISTYCSKCNGDQPCQANESGVKCYKRRDRASVYCQSHYKMNRQGKPIRELSRLRLIDGDTCIKHGDDYMNENRSCKMCRRAWAIRRLYGLEEEDIDDMVNLQGGVCAFATCKDELIVSSEGRSNFVVDHDHSTGEIRGLLCSRHNKLLGFARDSEQDLDDAKQYLKENRGIYR